LTDGLGAFIVDAGSIEWEHERAGPSHAPVTADPLFSQLLRLVKHARTYIKIAESSKRDEPAPDDASAAGLVPIPPDEAAAKAAKEALELAQRVVGIIDDIEAALGKNGAVLPRTAVPPGEGVGVGSAAEDAAYMAMHEDLGFDMREDIVPQATKALATGQIAQMSPQNATHLNKELATLANSLPPGVFLRVDETSLNEMRALIAGPEGTPYAFGLFEFSIKLPWDYPARSPTVKILTTAGGRVRFNPNRACRRLRRK
jgi:hypothetical protein